ncbi:MAG: hypothetical protein Q7K26_02880 [bacterium]|nr:hypothetical protein [bacterium]
MTKEQAKKRLEQFMGNDVLTFTIKKYPTDHWVAQCNEIDGIITGGTGYDLAVMEDLLQDAILTAAGIPAEHADGMLKRIWSVNPVIPKRITEIESSVDMALFQSTFAREQYAGMGQV